MRDTGGNTERTRKMEDEFFHQPNDKLFKTTFSNLENARAILQGQLPGELLPLVKWDTLSVVPSSFVDARFKASESDLLFSVQIGECPAYLYILFEHQSTEDPRIALRLLGYMTRIWEKHAEENPHPAKLPAIYPLVLAQANRRWRVSPRFKDLLDVTPETAAILGKYLPDFKFRLMELFGMALEGREGPAEVVLVLRALKAYTSETLLTDWVWDYSLLARLSPDAWERLARYIMNAGRSRELFLKRVEKLQDEIMKTKGRTIADEFREEGMEQGMEKGRLEKAREWVVKVLAARHGAVPPGLAEAIFEITDMARLEHLLTRAVLSESIDGFAQEL
jgi:predicted transposase YdaD